MKNQPKFSSDEMKKLHETLRKQLEEISAVTSEYAKKHSPAELLAFNQGINEGLKIATEEI